MSVWEISLQFRIQIDAARKTMLEQMDVFEERMRAWEDLLVGSGRGLQRRGIGILIGVVIQFYVFFNSRSLGFAL